ncbi:succinate dehydrogenase assembly factor 2, mitochondrial-like [Lepeophtheirus salmonis]|uniref:succinate dehydrogenase assembly factor 2, mitochondrial-like n=1 Tax=Lepeophtheirus salmonis TaxID=72036 RepID=UPI001AE6E7E9|nr:succinate dehydrogenase assembly factor 2, mitochondrial-like [Lepeophtheirus salmonis]
MNLVRIPRLLQSNVLRFCSSSKVPPKEPWIPEYVEKDGEEINEKRSRLMYQSRKRGMLENGLLLGSFASKKLKLMSPEQLTLYDRLINLPSNDWEIYYWAVGNKPTPEEFDNEVMDMIKEHARNVDREERLSLPDLQ